MRIRLAYFRVVTIMTFLGVVLNGCRRPNLTQETLTGSGSEAVSPTETLTATDTSVPSLAPTPTSTAFNVPRLPTPAATHALTNAILEHFFFGASSPDCELPCWQGLVVGQSNTEDVSEAFDQAFQFEGLPYLVVDDSPWSPGYINLSYAWDQVVENRVKQRFFAGALINPDTDTLELLRFSLTRSQAETYTPFHTDLSIVQIIRELGVPFYWGMALEGGGQGPGIHIRLTSFMIYTSGLSFYHSDEFPAQSVAGSNNPSYLIAQFCLNEDLNLSAADILRPLADGFTNLSPLEENTYGIREELHPLNEMIGIDAKELAKRAQIESNPCIELKVPEH